jgi:hypothetical protein
MRTAIGIVAFLALIGVLWSAITAHLRAADYFPALILRHPALANAFPAPGPNTAYGPIWPSYMRFLKEKRHLALPDPDLRAQGTYVLNLLYIHATSFAAFIVFVLWWRFGFD